MEGLFKIDKIDGKGFGWIALRDIKAGTLIYKEKHQFVPPRMVSDSTRGSFLDLMNSFYAMSENDQKEYLELHNAYLDLNSLPDVEKKWYFDIKNTSEDFEFRKQVPLHLGIQIPCFDSNLVLKIMCINSTNAFKGDGGVGIKVSRINHSCCPNSQNCEWEGEMEIRATSKILEGQEITTRDHP